MAEYKRKQGEADARQAIVAEARCRAEGFAAKQDKRETSSPPHQDGREQDVRPRSRHWQTSRRRSRAPWRRETTSAAPSKGRGLIRADRRVKAKLK